MNNFKLKFLNDKSLFKKCEKVNDDEFGKELETYVSDMTTFMYSESGVGLSAPQVGDCRRILVADTSYAADQKYGYGSLSMINPEILSLGDEYISGDEGCLSFPGLVVNVLRRENIKVKYFTPLGIEKIEEFDGMMGRIILHEIDHLDGNTLFSYASSLKRKNYIKRAAK